MTDITCLVEVLPAGVRRKCQLFMPCLIGLKSAIASCSVLGAYVNVERDRYQIFDQDFGEYTELSQTDTIGHMSRIRIIKDTPRTEACTPCANETPVVSAPRTQDNEMEEECQLQIDQENGMALVEGTESINCPFYIEQGTTADDDGNAYCLPQFGVLDLAIRNGEALKSSVHSKIIDIVYQSMVNYTIYPSKKFYFKVVNFLLLQYPSLADATGTGYDSWIVALRNKFKNERRKILSDRRVNEAREQFAQSRKRASNEKDTSVEELQRKTLKRTPHTDACAPSGEDEASITAHEQWLIREAKNPDPDETQIKERMDATYSLRAATLAVCSIATVKEKYPYLLDCARFCQEYKRMCGKNPLQETTCGIQKVIDLAKARTVKCSSGVLQRIQEVPYLVAGDTREKHVLAACALEVIARNVREPMACETLFVKEDDPLLQAVHGLVEQSGLVPFQNDTGMPVTAFLES
ncbi:uncharacterized protein LOC135395129 [Ornithodoros turicata]|uniref:uncharacterized protein LOC135395129 n=1 Tax=Ornithodoros turicata TaxID=34597 RepID=UPI0031395F32